MKRILYILAFATVCLIAIPNKIYAQCDEVADSCSAELFPFNSDGQYYRAQLFAGETAKVRITLYDGMIYRIMPCGRSKTGERLDFTLYDKKGNKLFSTEDVKVKEAFYDFSFGATTEYLIVAKFKSGDGCAAVLVGYQEEGKADEVELD